jgi:hypothetical protein
MDSLECVREALHSLIESSGSPRRVEEVVGARLWEIEAHEYYRATTKAIVAALLGYSSHAQTSRHARRTSVGLSSNRVVKLGRMDRSTGDRGELERPKTARRPPTPGVLLGTWLAGADALGDRRRAALRSVSAPRSRPAHNNRYRTDPFSAGLRTADNRALQRGFGGAPVQRPVHYATFLAPRTSGLSDFSRPRTNPSVRTLLDSRR